jgi:hypothetical protein
VARRQHPAVEVVDEFAVGADRFQHGFECRLHEVALDFGDAFVDPCVIGRGIVDHIAQDLGGDDHDHGDGQGFGGAGFGVGFGREQEYIQDVAEKGGDN